MSEGRLYLNDSGRYEHIRPDEYETKDYWTSGESIELHIGGHWIPGRIEYSHETQGYYFISRVSESDRIYNLNGIRARRPLRKS